LFLVFWFLVFGFWFFFVFFIIIAGEGGVVPVLSGHRVQDGRRKEVGLPGDQGEIPGSVLQHLKPQKKAGKRD
jgi:hypothetical protein